MCINQNTHSRQCLHCPPGCKVAYLGTPSAFELCMFGKKNTPPKAQRQPTDMNSKATTHMQAMYAAVHHSMNAQIPSRHKTKSSWHSATVADECHLRQSKHSCTPHPCPLQPCYILNVTRPCPCGEMNGMWCTPFGDVRVCQAKHRSTTTTAPTRPPQHAE